MALGKFITKAQQTDAIAITDLAAKIANLERELALKDEQLLELKDQRDVLERQVDELRFEAGKAPADVSSLKDAEDYKKKMDEYYSKLMLYELLIKRYAKLIEDGEAHPISDIKDFVRPAHPRIMDIASSITAGFGEHFDANAHLMNACEKAYEQLFQVTSVPPASVQFWLNIDEMLENKVADYMGKAILLCSLFRALDANASVLIVEMTDGSQRPLVSIRAGQAMFLIDPNEKHDFYAYSGQQNDVLRRFQAHGLKISKPLYEFNEQDYAQLFEESGGMTEEF